MRKTAYTLLASALFLGSASLALAAVTPLTFFCAPYTTPFVEGQAYTPSDASPCTFEPPVEGSSTAYILFQGTPGANPTFKQYVVDPAGASDFVTSQFVFTISSVPQTPGDPFFFAAFPSGDLDAAYNYFETGSNPPSDYSILNWHWGAPITVTADTKTINAGDPLSPLTATLSGFLSGDTAANSTAGSAACTTTVSDSSVAGDYPITCTQGNLSSVKYSFTPPTATYVVGTLHIVPAPPPPTDTQAPVITITNPLQNGVYAKSDSVVLTATVTDASALATTTYWFGNKKINPAQPLPLSGVSTPSVQSVSVSATDIYGNTATSTLKFFVVKTTNSCLLDIISVLVLITQDKTLPDKPTIQNLIADCSALLKGLHRYDDHGGHH